MCVCLECVGKSEDYGTLRGAKTICRSEEGKEIRDRGVTLICIDGWFASSCIFYNEPGSVKKTISLDVSGNISWETYLAAPLEGAVASLEDFDLFGGVSSVAA